MAAISIQSQLLETVIFSRAGICCTHTQSPLVYQIVSTAACMSKALLISVSQWGAVGIWSCTILCCTEMSHVLQDV